MKLNFKVDKTFKFGIEQLKTYLNYEESESGVSVVAVCGNRIGASLKNGIGTIYYKNKHHFFRELGVFIENAKKSDNFDITEDASFETMGVMFNMSSTAPATVKGNKELLNYLVIMGYNMVMLYTEDTIRMDKYPCFGLFRGRYTPEEIREIDDYAYNLGIEMIPCVECYGHMNAYLKWDEAKPIKDTSTVLLAREEATFEFLDEWIKTLSSCYRSRRIHIGMDEAHDMGRGTFLDKHGYVPRGEIFREFMEEVVKITDKYGLTPMMWSDMYFRISAKDGYWYYAKDTVIPEEVKKTIPKQVQLVYWHYGEEPDCDEYMIEKHLGLDRDIVFAGGLWDWTHLFPENNYAFEATSKALRACRKYGVKEMMMTSWSSANLYASLLGFSMSAELCYKENASEEHRRARFEFCTGGNFDAFMLMSNYHNRFGDGEVYNCFHDRFLGRGIFWQDILEGLYETYLIDRPMSGYYRENAEAMKRYHGKFEELYRFAQKVFEYVAVKAEIAETLVSAYKANDKATLIHISDDLVPSAAELISDIRILHRNLLRKLCTTITFGALDCRYGGMAARCETVKLLLDEFINGETDKIPELEEPRISKPLNAFGVVESFVGR